MLAAQYTGPSDIPYPNPRTAGLLPMPRGVLSAEWRQLTDFGDRPTFIARRVSWSADGRSILAAVGEGDADIVLLEGFVEGRKP